MSSSSSCSSSPYSSPETGVEMDMNFFPTDQLYQQPLLDWDLPADLLLQQQTYQIPVQQKLQHQPIQYGVTQMGLGTPPTSPHAPAPYNKFMGQNEIGMYYQGSQPQVIQNVYVITERQLASLLLQPEQPLLTASSSPQQLQEAQLEYLMLQQPDNLESSSLFRPSPITSSCSSSLSNSPFPESPLMAIANDFDLFPQQSAVGYPTVPVMVPQATSVQAIYNQGPVYPQLTPPMNQMDFEADSSSLFRQDAISAGLNDHHHHQSQEIFTTELSLLCKSPGKFPCCEQLPGEPIEDNNTSYSGSPLQDIQEIEYSESDSLSSEEDQEDGEESEQDPSYVPSSRARSHTTGGIHGPKSQTKARSKSMVISTGAPYGSPYIKEESLSPKTPARHDRRRSGSYTAGGHSHHHQLLDPENVPAIKDIHVCPVCQRRFTRPFNLRSHLMTHTTARPFPCDECHWKFTRQHDLLRHKRAKHPNSVTNGTTTNNAGQKKDAKSRTVSAA
ncbi:hypothetical protein BGX31_003224 [Mortierella sp. GBA43]|nr:hypothetical protein BGX31_003224 [Mortierella sp. GBA43]